MSQCRSLGVLVRGRSAVAGVSSFRFEIREAETETEGRDMCYNSNHFFEEATE